MSRDVVPRRDGNLPPSRSIGHRETGRRKKNDNVSTKDSLPWNQEVTDAQGRRRFHGAFTGGFSAGYFNTVGSKEGWTPSQFVSSRSKRAQRNKAKPEDFMDAEDLAEAAEVGKTVVMQSDFEQDKSLGKRKSTEQELQGMLTVKSESIGRQLMRAMGWREGKKIGEKEQDAEAGAPAKKVYGVARPPSEQEKQEKAQFNKWSGLYKTRLKTDLRGLGFHGREDVLMPPPGMGKTVKFGSMASSTMGLGLGALETPGAHDDVYSRRDDMSQYDIDIDVKGGARSADTDRHRRAATGPKIQSLAFVRAKTPEKPPKPFPTIEVPRDFVGVHRFQHDDVLLSDDIRRLHATASFLKGAQNQQITIAQRRKLLGERKLPGPEEKVLEEKGMSKEVIDLISESDRKRLAQSLENAFTTSGKSLKTVDEDPNAWKNQFTQDAAKQRRFERFLEIMGGARVKMPTDNLTNWQRQREMEEFQAIYNGKFKPGAANYKPGRQTNLEADCSTAAKLQMYGKLTRKVEPWVPDRLLCLRFNVPNPYEGRQLPDIRKKDTNSQRRYQETISILQKSKARRQKIKGPSMLSRTTPAALAMGKGINFVSKETRTFGFMRADQEEASSSSSKARQGGGSITNAGAWPEMDPEREKAKKEAEKKAFLMRSNKAKDSDDDDEDLKLQVPANKPSVELFKAIFDDNDDDKVSSSSDEDEDEDEDEDDKVGDKKPSMELERKGGGAMGAMEKEMRVEKDKSNPGSRFTEKRKANSLPEFSKGDKLVYKGKERVIVVAAHPDPQGAYYTVRKSDGSEVQTVPKFLTEDKEADREEDSAPFPALPNEGTTPVVAKSSVFVGSSDSDDDSPARKKKKSKKKKTKKSKKAGKKEKKKKKKKKKE